MKQLKHLLFHSLLCVVGMGAVTARAQVAGAIAVYPTTSSIEIGSSRQFLAYVPISPNTINWLVNLQDAINTKHHSDRRRLNGYCGPAGFDGPNIVCINGHEVGTEHSDCWMPHVLELMRELVTQNIVRGDWQPI